MYWRICRKLVNNTGITYSVYIFTTFYNMASFEKSFIFVTLTDLTFERTYSNIDYKFNIERNKRLTGSTSSTVLLQCVANYIEFYFRLGSSKLLWWVWQNKIQSVLLEKWYIWSVWWYYFTDYRNSLTIIAKVFSWNLTYILKG